MPKIRRHKLPPPLLAHLLTGIRQRNISPEQITLLARWLDTEPEVPESKWFKKFPDFIVCGEDEFIKTPLPGFPGFFSLSRIEVQTSTVEVDVRDEPLFVPVSVGFFIPATRFTCITAFRIRSMPD